MKIVIYTYDDYEISYSPISKRIKGLALSLMQSKHDIYVIYPKNYSNSILDISWKIDKLGIKYFGFPNVFSSNHSVFLNYNSGKNLYLFLNHLITIQKVDCLLFYGISFLHFYRGIKLCKKNGIICLADVTEFYPISLKRIFSPNFWDHFLFRKVLIKRFNGIVSISNFWYDYVSKVKVPTVRIPAILLDEYNCTPNTHYNNHTFTLSYLGSLSNRDLPKTIINGIKIAYERGLKVRLLIIGDINRQSFGRSLKKKMETYPKLNEFIEVTGWVSDSELEKLKQSSDAFVLLRKNNVFSNACFATRIPELMATKKPVILSAIDEMRTMFIDKRNVFFIEPGNTPKELADTIEYLIKNKLEAKIVGEQGSKLVEEFLSITYLGPKLNTFLKRLTNKLS